MHLCSNYWRELKDQRRAIKEGSATINKGKANSRVEKKSAKSCSKGKIAIRGFDCYYQKI